MYFKLKCLELLKVNRNFLCLLEFDKRYFSFQFMALYGLDKRRKMFWKPYPGPARCIIISTMFSFSSKNKSNATFIASMCS